MGCGSSKDVKEIDMSNQVIDNISADLEAEKQNLLPKEECRSSDGVGDETHADRELLGRKSRTEVDREKEENDSRETEDNDSTLESFTLEGTVSKERHEQWLFRKGTQVKLIKSIPNSIEKGSLGVVQHLEYNVVGVKFEGSTEIKFSSNGIDEWLEIYSNSERKSFVENGDCEIVQPVLNDCVIVQPVLYGSASIWAAVNIILDDRKSPKWVLTQKLRCFAIKLINLLEDSGFNPEFEQIIALHEGLGEEWLWKAVLENIVLNFHVPEKQRWMLVAKLRADRIKVEASHVFHL